MPSGDEVYAEKMQVSVLAFEQSKKSTILQFFLVFAVIMCYYSVDTGTVCISEEWHGRVFSLIA